MKISMITPTHDPKYINELADSILSQTYDNWEWIVVTNKGAKVDLPVDDRIKVIPLPVPTTSVGAIKKFACSQCTGKIIAEVDHDDLLVPEALAKVMKEFQDKNVGFVYSDNAKLGSFTPYNNQYGWKFSMFPYHDQELYHMHSFPPTPSSLSLIWYAPDHIRAWRKSVYDSIGGHDPELSVCDDHDLICRLYMVTEFKHIPEVLYIYRIHGDNTWLERNKAIQIKTRELYDKYVYQLAERWCDLKGLKKIDLCGGFNKPKGYESIDLANADIIADLEKGIPLPDNSVGVVRAHDALEHIKDSPHLMAEIHRVLVDGGMLLSFTPSTDGRGAFQDPTHVSFWNQNSFWYYTRPEQMKFINNTSVSFGAFNLKSYFPSEYHRINNIPYVKADLVCIKDDGYKPLKT